MQNITAQYRAQIHSCHTLKEAQQAAVRLADFLGRPVRMFILPSGEWVVDQSKAKVGHAYNVVYASGATFAGNWIAGN